MSDVIIKAEELTYVYGEGTPFRKVAVDGISFEIERGEFVGVIGHTGSGKSTLMQHLNGLLSSSSGNLFFDGRNIREKKYPLRELRFKVGLVFQYPEYQLFEDTVEKDIGYGPKNMGLSPEEIRRRVEAAAEAVGLDKSVLERSPFDLSGGQKRRVAIAGIMAMEPEVLVLDEPTAGLDPMGRREILSLIRDYKRQSGCTVLLVSHSMETVADLADRVMVLNRGRLEMFGPVGRVFAERERLREIGLDVPQITRVFEKLRKKGYPVSDTVYTPKEAVEEIMKHIK